MPDALDKREVLIQNLKDAGCDSEQISICLNYSQSGKVPEMKKLLGMHKNHLMKEVHTRQKEVDCLDYLLYSLEQEEKRRICK